MRKKVKTSTVRSAGGVVLREGEEGLEALLIATHGKQRWSLPKGRIEPSESSRAAALREVAEETGITARILAPLETIEYWFYAGRNRRFHKFVEYFLMAYQGGQPQPQLSEVDDVRWWPFEEAVTLVAYANDRRLLKRAQEKWGEG
ncbi:MAG: NUDIX hydrolase [Chloroflexota bacterium]|nr:NUDIX hydrolase [Chloroflexota bacterium]